MRGGGPGHPWLAWGGGRLLCSTRSSAGLGFFAKIKRESHLQFPGCWFCPAPERKSNQTPGGRGYSTEVQWYGRCTGFLCFPEFLEYYLCSSKNKRQIHEIKNKTKQGLNKRQMQPKPRFWNLTSLQRDGRQPGQTASSLASGTGDRRWRGAWLSSWGSRPAGRRRPHSPASLVRSAGGFGLPPPRLHLLSSPEDLGGDDEAGASVNIGGGGGLLGLAPRGVLPPQPSSALTSGSKHPFYLGALV